MRTAPFVVWKVNLVYFIIISVQDMEELENNKEHRVNFVHDWDTFGHFVLYMSDFIVKYHSF